MLSTDKIERIYKVIEKYHDKHLKEQGVKLPSLRHKSGKYMKDALVLIYLAQNYPRTKPVSKTELTAFVRKFYPETADVQQARHLAMQKGWDIVSGTRGNMVETVHEVKYGEYKLRSLEQVYPAFKAHRQQGVEAVDFETVKENYGYRCATCGSKEGEPIFNYPRVKAKLTMAHMDPRRPATEGNVIPQCQLCNRAYRNYWAFDKRGRVIAVADPKVIWQSSEEVQKEVYIELHRKFGGRP